MEKVDIPKIKLDHIYKEFATRRQVVKALEDINMEVYKGDFISLLGPSGCGKSTIIRIISGITEQSSGDFYIDGTKCDNINIKSLLKNMGFVFQQANLFPWLTVKQNVQLPLKIFKLHGKEWDERVDALIDIVGLTKYKNSYPSSISGGMVQRIGVIRSMVYDPEILLMDEPFGALDTMTREILDLEILDIWDKTKKTIIFITHDVEEAVLVSSKVVVMGTNPGRITGIVDVDLPYPRTLSMQKERMFVELEHKLTNMIGSIELSKIK